MTGVQTCALPIYALSTVPESNDKGSWAGWRIEPGALLLTVKGGRSIFQKAMKLREQVDAGTVRANDTAGAATESSQRQRAPDAAGGDEEIPF